MPKMKSDQEVLKFHQDMKVVRDLLLNAHALHIAVGANYYSGRQFSRLARGMVVTPTRRPVDQLEPNYDPDSNHLRVVMNHVSRLVQKWWGKTTPQRMDVDVQPIRGDFSMDSHDRAKAAEDALNAMLPDMRSRNAVAEASFKRCWSGDGVIFLVLSKAEGGAKQVLNAQGEPFQIANRWVHWASETMLSVSYDPAVKAPDFRDHQWVGVHRVLTRDQIENDYGINVSVDDLTPIGTLAAQQRTINTLVGWNVFPEFAVDQQQLGALVHQYMWRSSEEPYFDRFALILETKHGSRMIENGPTPFGGDGLPLVKLSCFPRVSNVFSNGLTHALLDRQDINNIVWTAMLRSLMLASSVKVMYDERSIKPEDFRRRFTNRVGGGLPYSGGRGSEKYDPPHALQMPPAPALAFQLAQIVPELMHESTHRSSASFGQASPREPVGGLRLRISQSDEVPNHIMVNDEFSLQNLLEVTLGTMVKHISPSMVMRLMRRGFDEAKLAQLLTIDTEIQDLALAIKPGSTQPRTMAERRRDLFEITQLGGLTADELRREMAVTLNQPITRIDAVAMESAVRAARSILAGDQWDGRRGISHDIFIAIFQLALNDPKVQEGDEETRNRLIESVLMQQEARKMDQIETAGPMDVAASQRGQPSLAGDQVAAMAGPPSAQPQLAPGGVEPLALPAAG